MSDNGNGDSWEIRLLESVVRLMVPQRRREEFLGDLLEEWSRKSWPPDAKERITSAINKYKNEIVDPIPILITVVGKIGSEEHKLYLAIWLSNDRRALRTENPVLILNTVNRDESSYQVKHINDKMKLRT